MKNSSIPRSLFLIVFILAHWLVQGQTRIMEIPLLLENPLQDYQDNRILSASGTQRGTVWQVFLIENHNNYSYLEPFYVTNELSTAVKVVEGRYVAGGSLLSGYREIEIPKSKLLLWKDCLVEKDVVVDEYRADFPKKAMVINRLVGTGTNVEQNPGYYKAPNTLEANRIGQPKEFTVLFVYKVQNNCMLLGTKPRIEDPANAKIMIKGWAPFIQLTPWNHHLALEFNWEAADQRRTSQTPIKLYDNAASAPNFCSNSGYVPSSAVGRTVFREQTFHSNRVQGFYTRTPVLTQGIELSNRTPEIGFIGEIVLQSIPGMEGCIDQIDPPLNALDDIRIKTQINVKKSSVINILFVVDGTRSMERYSSSIQMAMSTTMNSLIQEYGKDDRISFNFGAVVYRDHLENNNDCPGIGGNYVVDISNNGNWTSNIPSINQFFATSMVETRNKCDKEHPEAVYYGLSKAVQTFAVDKMNTNYIILIGDACNNDAYWSNSVSQQSVIKLIAENNFNLIAFQVHHVNDPVNNAFNLYREQCRDIIEGVALIKNQNLRANYNLFRSSYGNCSSFWDRFYERFPTDAIQLRQVGNTYDINTEQCPIIARFTPSPDNDSLTVRELRTLLDTALTKIAIDNDKWIKNVWIGDVSNISYMNQLAYFYLLKCGLQFSETELNRTGKTDKITHKDAMTYIFLNKQLYEKAYTCYQPNWSDDPLFQYVAFLGQIHLARSRDFFSKTLVTPMPQITPLRNAIYDIWYQILCVQLGICNDHRDFSNLRIGECMAYVTGLPAPERFRNLYVRDLTNPTVMADSNIYGLCVDFIYAFLHIESLLSNQNKLTSANFMNYQSYILKYLETKGIIITPPNRKPYFDQLAQRFRNYGSLYALDNNGNSRYPNVCIDINNPNNPFNYYYWVDTRIFPSKIARGSDLIYEVARQMPKN